MNYLYSSHNSIHSNIFRAAFTTHDSITARVASKSVPRLKNGLQAYSHEESRLMESLKSSFPPRAMSDCGGSELYQFYVVYRLYGIDVLLIHIPSSTGSDVNEELVGPYGITHHVTSGSDLSTAIQLISPSTCILRSNCRRIQRALPSSDVTEILRTEDSASRDNSLLESTPGSNLFNVIAGESGDLCPKDWFPAGRESRAAWKTGPGRSKDWKQQLSWDVIRLQR
jgi:hypothetical protein